MGVVTGHDVTHRDSPGDQRIGDQLAVTLPPFRLGTHDGGTTALGKHEQRLKVLVEFSRLHVVGIPAEPRVAPRSMR